MNEKTETPAHYCEKQISHFKEKAIHNKSEALWCFRLIMVSTLLAPLFVTLGAEVWTSKVIPSLLSVLAAFCTAWIQLRKPQELWSLYRTAQRELEDQLVKYTYQIEGYENTETADKLLAKNVAKLSLQTHQKWVAMVPTSDKLSAKAANTQE